jgi:hypothetical protein
MKQLRTLSIALFFLFPKLLMSQSNDYVTGFGFNTLPDVLTPLTGERWLAVGTGSAFPGGLFSDTVVAVVFNAAGEILLEKRLDLPSSEVYNVISAVGTPDGGFAIAISLDLCDASFNNIFLSVFDADAKLKWSKQAAHLLSHLEISPGGTLTGIDDAGEKIVALDLENGAFVSNFAMNNSGNYFHINDFEFLNGSNIILAVGGPALQRWEKLDSSTYYLADSKDFAGVNSPDKIVHDSAIGGACYTFDRGTNKLFVFDPSSLDFAVLGDYPFKIIDLISKASNLVALVEQNASTFLVNIDFQGGIMDTIRTFPALLKGTALSFQNNTLAVAGINGSGPLPNNNPWLPFNAHQLWLHTNHLSDEPALFQTNASLSDVVQTTALQLDSLFSAGTGTYHYNISGGHFKIQVTNLGETILESVDVQTGFDWNKNWICFYRPVQKRHFSGLGLLPHESIWLDFGDIQALYQSSVPAEFCFWTSAPNHKPDAAPENDIYCKSINTVKANEPKNEPFSVSPNPANDLINVSFHEPSDASWKLFDMTGRQVKAGATVSAVAEINISTDEMVPGLYALWVNGVCLKVIIEHF